MKPDLFPPEKLESIKDLFDDEGDAETKLSAAPSNVLTAPCSEARLTRDL